MAVLLGRRMAFDNLLEHALPKLETLLGQDLKVILAFAAYQNLVRVS